MLEEEGEDDPVDKGEDDEQSTITNEPSTTKDGVQPSHRQKQQEEPVDFPYSYDYLNKKGPSLEDVEPEEDLEESIQSTDQEETAGASTHNNERSI